MESNPIPDLLAKSFEGLHLSRNGRRAIGDALGLGDSADRREARKLAFRLARQAAGSVELGPLLEWVESIVEATWGTDERREADAAEAYFSPGDACYRRIVGLCDHAGRSADVCVFTITDDRIADAILAAHSRGVAVRIITDNDKSLDLGSDVGRFERAGIPVRVDRTEFHMHHKFALFDGRLLLTGSYNWTRGAAASNEENIVVTPDGRLVGLFQDVFEKLWKKLDRA